MRVEQFKLDSKAHMDTLKGWWHERMDLPLPNYMLSDFGFMSFNDKDEPIAAMFLFPVLGCKMAMLGYPVASLNASSQDRDAGLHAVVTYIEEFAKLMQYDWLISYPGNKAAQRLYAREYFQLGDMEVLQFLKRI